MIVVQAKDNIDIKKISIIRDIIKEKINLLAKILEQIRVVKVEVKVEVDIDQKVEILKKNQWKGINQEKKNIKN